MTEKPMMIPPSVNSPDYGGFLRRSLQQTPLGERSFARTVAEQETSIRQKIAASSGLSEGASGAASSPHAEPSSALSQTGQMGGTGGAGGLPSMPGAGSRIAAMAAMRTSMMEQAGNLQRRETSQSANHEEGGVSDPMGQTSGQTGGQVKGQTEVQGRLDTRSISMPQRGEQTGGAVFRAGGMALDERALATLQRVGQGIRSVVHRSSVRKTTEEGEGLGKLSARYESGSQGAAAIGYDRNGGTSYGKYQISSRQGTFGQFLSFLTEEAPDLAERLRKAGKPNTGGTRGGVPSEWQAIAAEQPERFEKLQENFIRDSHYSPALESVQGSLGLKEISAPLQEVLWSTAVQHGPPGAKRIFEQAAGQLAASGKSVTDEKALIETVYSLRKGQFGSSAPSVQAAVRQRFDDERRQALAMLREKAVVA